MGHVRETDEILALHIRSLCCHCLSQGCGLNDNDPLPWEASVAEKGIKLLGTEYQPPTKAMYLVSFINLRAEMEKKGRRTSQGLLSSFKRRPGQPPVPRVPSGVVWVASGCGWPWVSKKGILQSSSWRGMSCARLRGGNTMPRGFHWVNTPNLDCFV